VTLNTDGVVLGARRDRDLDLGLVTTFWTVIQCKAGET
jgi:hypothetical protein